MADLFEKADTIGAGIIELIALAKEQSQIAPKPIFTFIVDPRPGADAFLNPYDALEAMGDRQGVIYCRTPPRSHGFYELDRTLTFTESGQSLLGESPGNNGTKFVGTMDDGSPMIKFVGQTDTNHNTFSSIKNIQLDGNNRQNECDGILLDAVSQFTMTETRLNNIRGTALNCHEVWDTFFQNNWHENNGDALRQKPDTVLRDGSIINPYINCNEVKFFACQFERLNYQGVVLDQNSAGNHFSHCKFHGFVPNPLPFEEMIIKGRVNSVSDCNFTQGGNATQLVVDGKNNRIVNNNIQFGLAGGLSVRGTGNHILGNNALTNSENPMFDVPDKINNFFDLNTRNGIRV